MAGLLNTSQQVGGGVGIALGSVTAATRTVGATGVAATVAGYRASLYVALVLLGLAGVVAGTMLMSVARPAPHQPSLDTEITLPAEPTPNLRWRGRAG